MGEHIGNRPMVREDVTIKMMPLMDHLRGDKLLGLVPKLKYMESDPCREGEYHQPNADYSKTDINYKLIFT